MGNKIELKLEKREVFGKKVATLRAQSIVPAVVYGAGMDPSSVQADEGEVVKVVQAAGRHTPVHVNVSGKKRIVMIKDISRDPVRGDITHLSLHAVKANEPVIAEVPVKLEGEGESKAERAGLIVIQALESLEVKALPMDLPEALVVSVLDLEAEGDKLVVSDIKIPEGVEIVDYDDGREGTDDDHNSVMDLSVATVYEPGALAAANDAAGGDAETADADQVESDQGAEAEADAADKDK